MVRLWDLYSIFFKMGIFTFGGGYAMLPILKSEAVEKRKWVTEEELLNYYSIGQCTPGDYRRKRRFVYRLSAARLLGYDLGDARSDFAVNHYYSAGGNAASAIYG